MSISSNSIQSHAKLSFAYKKNSNKTILTHRSLGGLFHLSKTYWDHSMLLAQLINPTAGVFNGDEMLLEVDMQPNTKVSLISPSATRFYAMKSIGAKITQNFHVGKQAFLEYRPDYSIPHAQSKVSQSNHIYLEDQSRLFFIERFMPGRVATGEQFAFKAFSSQTKIYYKKKPIMIERMSLSPNTAGWPLHVPNWNTVFSASAWLVGEDITHLTIALKKLEKSTKNEPTEALLGFSQVEDNAIVVRILAAQSITLKKLIVELRNTASQHFKEFTSAQRILHSNHT